MSIGAAPGPPGAPCPACSREGPAGARFCAACGARLPAACAGCRAPLPEGARFCPQCGQPAAGLAPASPGPAAPAGEAPVNYTPPHLAGVVLAGPAALEGERKSVTVLFCDVAGSTGLAERLGPDAMHDLLGRFFERALAEVHRYEGTVNQFLGDGFMALFGAPVAHEDHARRGALAALAIARTFAGRPVEPEGAGAVCLRLRMGLNTGSVVVGALGDNLRMDYTAVGDTTHLAARLQQMAEPGEILVAASTARLVEDEVALEPLGLRAVRGLSAPVAVHRLAGERASPARAGEARRRSTFVGRERELARLEELLARVRAEGRGHAIGIVGDPGAGKSRLMAELRERAAPAARWLEGRCLSHDRRIPYSAVRGLLREQCGIGDLCAPEEAAVQVRRALAGVGLDDAGRAADLLEVLGIGEGRPIGEDAGAEAAMARTFEALRQLLLRASRARPGAVVVEVEDLHWIDPTSEAFVASLVESLAAAPLLLIATYRPGYRPSWLAQSWTSQLSLPPLTAGESLHVARSVLPGLESSDARLQAIVDRAEGNPFFLEELARSLGEGDPARPTAAMPETIQGVLAARIDRLAPALKRRLQTASVLGREFPARLLARVEGAPGRLGDELAELARLEFLHQRFEAEEPTWAFKHALTQEVAGASLLARRRRELHQRAAVALEDLHRDRVLDLAPRLADHYAAARAWPAVVVHARRAAERARAAYANREALARYEQALDAAERAAAGGPERLALLEARAALHGRLGDLDAARADLEGALRLADAAGDVAARGRLLGTLSALWGGHRDYTRALALASEAVELLGGSGDRRALAEARSRLGIMLLNLGRLAESERQLDQARALFAELGDEAGQARAVDILAMCLAQTGQTARAEACAAEAVRGLAAIGDREAGSSALCTLGFSSMFRRGWSAGVGHFERAIATAREIGAPAAEAYARGMLAEMAPYLGRLGRALDEAREALRLARSIGHEEWITHALGTLGRVHAECGDVATARQLHEEMVGSARRIGTSIWIAKSLGHLAEDLMLGGDCDAPGPLLDEAIEAAGEGLEPVSRPLVVRVELALRRDRPGEALAALEAARERVARFGPLLAARLGAVEGEVLAAAGRVAAAEEVLRAVWRQAEEVDARAALWHACLTLARLLQGAGRREEARVAGRAGLTALEQAAAEIADAPLRRSLEATARFREALTWR